MSEPDEITRAALDLLAATQIAREQDLVGRRITVSAGGTREPIDPVRFLGNRSSGRQGVDLALAAADRGATVDLAAANIEEAVLAPALAHPGITVHRVGTALELQELLHRLALNADTIIMAAAVADYRVAEVSDAKITKEGSEGEPPTIKLIENPDVIAGLTSQRRSGQRFVAFAAETTTDDDELIERARRKVARKDADLIAVNRVGWSEGFERDTNSITIVSRDGAVLGEATGSKRDTADALLDALVAL